MAAPLEPFSAQAGRKRFTIVEDILLSREVLAMNPFVNFTRWDTVAANLNEALGRNFSVRGVRDRCDLLLGLFKRDDRTNLRKEHLGSLEKRAEEDRTIKKKLEIALQERRLVMEELQIERRLAMEERQVTLSEDRLAFEKEKFYVLQEAAAEERSHLHLLKTKLLAERFTIYVEHIQVASPGPKPPRNGLLHIQKGEFFDFAKGSSKTHVAMAQVGHSLDSLTPVPPVLPMASRDKPPEETRLAYEKADALNELGQYLWENPELAFKEKKAHDYITKYLESEGFSVTRNYLLDTAFRAEYGAREGKDVSRGEREDSMARRLAIACQARNSRSAGLMTDDGGPLVIIMCEYDALPEIGHACGHNLIAECAVATGIAMKKALESDSSLSGKVVVLGTPGEEGGQGKFYLLRDGAFDGADVALMAHPFTKNISNPVTSALAQLLVTYEGKPAHAGGAPWDGINALDAAVGAYVNVSMLRQQMKPDYRATVGIENLREVIRDVVREELKRLLPSPERPAAVSIAEAVREEVHRALLPEVPVAVAPERPVLTYAAAAKREPPVAAHYQPAPRREAPAPQYAPRPEQRGARKTDIWRTADRRPLCYHFGEADHIYRRCPYRQLGLRGFAPNDPRPRLGERPRDSEDYLRRSSSPESSPRRVFRSPSPRRSPSPFRRSRRDSLSPIASRREN
ncbi:hypothetical protein HPB47_001747 [Ixodes persulcatus]|uniref:Uncharacterized protein n=1 Tax=Ixodes persulcatus TaxID=34615 RepID=A0AC60PNB1_IXOPE|nr:hypothetical protein HPB47_001747 [Ixodes persulcatus]